MLLNPKKIKQENIQSLNEMGIFTAEHLPYLDKNKFRDSQEVGIRAVVLAALVQLNFGAPNDFVENYLESNDLTKELTINEKELLSKDYNDWSQQDQINLEWSMDAIWALVWAGGQHPHLTFNTSIENTLSSMLPQFHENEEAETCIKSFKLLPNKTLFKELDKFYRAHWYARNNKLTGRNDDKVNLSMIMERRKALEWICDTNLQWDDIPLDT